MNIEEAKKIAKGITTDDLLNYWEGPEEPYEAIQIVLNELEKKDKVIDTMAEYIEECTGSCPNDMYDWQEIDCDKECEISMKKCWIEYFYKEVEIPKEN